MTLLEQLRKNLEGISLNIPNEIQLMHQSPRQILFRINDQLPLFEVNKSVYDLDLQPDYQPILLQELAFYARKDFEDRYRKESASFDKEAAGLFSNKPRTSDPNWSPIIKAEITKIDSIPVLYVLRRLSYWPGSEFITSNLVIPTSQGTYEINMHSKAGTTGYRESVLYMVLMEKNKDIEPEDLMKSCDQSYYDDPEKDNMFPEHPLSLLREGYRWVLNEGNLKITAPAPNYPKGEICLENVGCTIIPPPGYLFCEALTSLMSKTLVSFVKVILSAGNMGGGKKMLGIWRPTDKDARKITNREELKKFAIKSTEAWKKEGIQDIKIETEDLPDFNSKPQIACHVKFKTGNEATQSLARWFIDPEGHIFRVDVSCVLFFTKDELNQELELVLKSWRRLPIIAEVEPVKPWWKFW